MKKTKSLSNHRALLLRLIDEAYDKKAWHGPNLRGSIRRVQPQEAVWRPRAGRRNIAEIVVHCAYWKYAVRRRIRGDKRGSFPLKGSNWFVLPAKLTKEQWREYVALLDGQHRALRETVASAPIPMSIGTLLPGASNQHQPAIYIYGIAMHDTYHAGQVRIIKALYKQAKGVGSHRSPRPNRERAS